MHVIIFHHEYYLCLVTFPTVISGVKTLKLFFLFFFLLKQQYFIQRLQIYLLFLLFSDYVVIKPYYYYYLHCAMRYKTEGGGEEKKIWWKPRTPVIAAACPQGVVFKIPDLCSISVAINLMAILRRVRAACGNRWFTINKPSGPLQYSQRPAHYFKPSATFAGSKGWQ